MTEILSNAALYCIQRQWLKERKLLQSNSTLHLRMFFIAYFGGVSYCGGRHVCGCSISQTEAENVLLGDAMVEFVHLFVTGRGFKNTERRLCGTNFLNSYVQ